MSDEIHFLSGFTTKDLVAYGISGLVVLDTSTGTVVKASPNEERSNATAVEQQIYERFVQRGGHKGILIYYGTFEWGIRIDTEADIFAFGSTLYELMNESRPYAGLLDRAIEESVIAKCWYGECEKCRQSCSPFER
ncbi:hypothetical protein B0H63DRAFT_496881 [Podospora didyma]|uniref:Protein kinase domain-containing protein n=1 Tax=Podospora didyma TaxID=330526 RepID=A0AAE0N6S0_9PEZI|nr:hypothetical protein B0H63DRAFT_496881 [Podospora didyma]